MEEEKYLHISRKKIPVFVLLWILFICIGRTGHKMLGMLLFLGIVGYMVAASE